MCGVRCFGCCRRKGSLTGEGSKIRFTVQGDSSVSSPSGSNKARPKSKGGSRRERGLSHGFEEMR
jgi:hypothetical protein